MSRSERLPALKNSITVSGEYILKIRRIQKYFDPKMGVRSYKFPQDKILEMALDLLEEKLGLKKEAGQ